MLKVLRKYPTDILNVDSGDRGPGNWRHFDFRRQVGYHHTLRWNPTIKTASRGTGLWYKCTGMMQPMAYDGFG